MTDADNAVIKYADPPIGACKQITLMRTWHASSTSIAPAIAFAHLISPTNIYWQKQFDREQSLSLATRVRTLRINLVFYVGIATGVVVCWCGCLPYHWCASLDRPPRSTSNAGGGERWKLGELHRFGTFVDSFNNSESLQLNYSNYSATVTARPYPDSSPLSGSLPRTPHSRGIFPGPRDPVIPCVASFRIPHTTPPPTTASRTWDARRGSEGVVEESKMDIIVSASPRRTDYLPSSLSLSLSLSFNSSRDLDRKLWLIATEPNSFPYPTSAKMTAPLPSSARKSSQWNVCLAILRPYHRVWEIWRLLIGTRHHQLLPSFHLRTEAL